MNIEYEHLSSKNIKLQKQLKNYELIKVKADINKLKFNPYNDRFAMEANKFQIDHEKQLGLDEASQKHIYDILYESNKNKKRNDITKKDILEKGVIEDIVIDENGIILDGNRRIAILKNIIENSNNKLNKNQLEQFSEPELILIKKKLMESEIREIETILQVGEDQKVSYDVINMYLKINRLYLEEKNKNLDDDLIYKKISSLLGSTYTTKDVKKMHGIFKLMEKYLRYFQKPKMYDLLKNKEDHFKQIYSFNNSSERKSIDFKNLIGTNSLEYEDTKTKIEKILFTLTAVHIEGKEFRKIVPTAKSTKSILLFEDGLNKIENWISKSSASEPSKIDHNLSSNSKYDKAIDNIISQTIKIKRNKNHDAATKDILRSISNNIKSLEGWQENLSLPYKRDEVFEKKIYECINQLKLIIKKYKEEKNED